MNRIITFLLLLFSAMLAAQPNFVDGSITKLNGETITGKIDYRAWILTPREIRFYRTDAPKKIETYTTHEIAGLELITIRKNISGR